MALRVRPVRGAIKPKNIRLRYDRGYWGRLGAKPQADWPMFSVGRGGGIPDHSGNGNDLSWNGSLSWHTMGHGIAIKGDGSTGYLSAANSNVCNPAGAFTVIAAMVWSANANAAIISKRSSGGLAGWELVIPAADTTKIALNLSDASSNLIAVRSTASVSDGTMHIVGATYTGSGLASGVNVFVDGIVGNNITNTATIGSVQNAYSINIFRRPAGTFAYFSQYILQVLFFDGVALTPAQIYSFCNKPWARFSRRDYAFGVASGAYTQALSGSLSFAGAVGRGTAIKQTATANFSGVPKRGVTAKQTAAVTFTGTQKTGVAKLVAGALSFTGAIRRAVGSKLTGALSFTGSTARNITATLAGVLSFVGTLTTGQNHFKTLTAALTFAGNLPRSVASRVVGSLSFSGADNRATHKTLTGSLSFSGAITRLLGLFLKAALTFTGNTKRTITTLLAATLSFSGVLNTGSAIFKTLTAALTFAGLTNRSITAKQTGALTFAGAANKNTGKLLAGALAFVGTLGRGTAATFTASLQFIGSLPGVGKKLLLTLYQWITNQ